MKMGFSTVTSSGLQLPTQKLHRKFIHRDKNLISKDLALVPKVISPQLYGDLPKIIPRYVKMLKVTQIVSSLLGDSEKRTRENVNKVD